MKICILLFRTYIQEYDYSAPGSVLLQYNKIIMHKWNEDSFVVVYSFHILFLFLYTLTRVQLHFKKGYANKSLKISIHPFPILSKRRETSNELVRFPRFTQIFELHLYNVTLYVSALFRVFKCGECLFPPADFTLYVFSNSKHKHVKILPIFLMHNIVTLLCWLQDFRRVYIIRILYLQSVHLY